MHEDHPIIVSRNPAQTVASVVKLFGFRVRGNSVYIFFGGLALGVFLAVAAYSVHIALAALVMPLPPVVAAVFIRKFVVGKPRGFFGFYLEEKLSGNFLKKPQRRVTHALV